MYFSPEQSTLVSVEHWPSREANLVTESLFQQLKQIGIDDELAHQVAASLDPDHNATKKDVLVLQEAILQVQARTDERYHQHRFESDERYHQHRLESDKRYNQHRLESDERYNQHRLESDQRYHELRAGIYAVKEDIDKSIHELKDAMTDIRIEFHSRHRQAIYAFGALLASILTVLLVNFYLHG